MKILVVDDDDTCRMIMAAYTKPFGDVETTIDGKQAMFMVNKAILDGAPYQLVCLDVMMPEMDGFTVLKGIRALEECYGIPKAKVVMTTAVDSFKGVSTAYNNQCDAYLVKPITKERARAEFITLGFTPITNNKS